MGDILMERPNKYQCVFCCRNFTRMEHLKRHIVGLHVKNIYICGICGLVSKDSTEICEHMQENHPQETPKFVCCACEIHFSTLSELQDHEESAHLACDKTSCPICSVPFKREDNMLRHYKAQHTNSPLVCNHCLKEFKRQDYLTKHLRVKHNDSPINTEKMACPECAMPFKRRDHMLRHYKTQHTNSPLFCSRCFKEFKRQDHLTRHLRHRHNVPTVKNPKK